MLDPSLAPVTTDLLDYHALERAPVGVEPYPHVVVPGFVRATALSRIVAGLPAMSSGGSFPPGSLRLDGAGRALVEALEGPALRDAIAARFQLDLSDAPTMLTIRGRTRPKDGRIHRDSEAKRVTVLLYLNPASEAWAAREGCLRLLRGPDDLEDYAVEVPPVDGTLLAFPNGPTTWHGHRPYVGRRYAIQLNYMAAGRHARAELRRHRLSAFLKRFTNAA